MGSGREGILGGRWLVLLALAGALLAAAPGAQAAPFAYVTNLESGNVSQYDTLGDGGLSPIGPATAESGPADVAVSPNGRSAYVLNFNVNTISQYDINATTGVLTAKSPATVAGGDLPRAVAITPDGRSAYVANQAGGDVSQYDID